MSAFDFRRVLDSIVETIVDGLVVMDEQSCIRIFNPAAETIFGYSQDEVIGERVEMLMPDPFRSEHHLYVKRYEKTDVPHIIGIGREVRARHKSGKVFPIHLSVGAFQSEGVRGYVGIIRDLTDEVARRKRLDDLQQSHFRLSRLDAMNQMGAAIAHELNQPLAALSNYMEAGRAMIDRRDGHNHPDMARLLTVMDRASEQTRRAASVLTRMRTFVETGERQTSLADPRQICDDAVGLVSPSLSGLNITLDTDIAPDTPLFVCDPVQIQQVLVNLLRNSADALRNIEGARHITLACSQIEDAMHFSVADTGTGIAPDVMENLFTPQHSSKADGMGIGLAICRSIVEAHGGRIEARANSPKGTVFHIILPVGDRSQSEGAGTS
jgi:two-component system sensor kinase FixL